MKGYILIDKNNGNVDCAFSWQDNREIQTADYPKEIYQEIVTINDFDTSVSYCFLCYNSETQSLENKLKVTLDKKQINSLNPEDVINISIAYPVEIDEKCLVTIDGHTVEIDIIKGTASFQYSSEVVGKYNLKVESTSHYGKTTAYVEVI